MENEFTLTPDYWDCECEGNFIHRKEESFCKVCQRFVEEQPESRVNEAKDWLEVQHKDVLMLIEKVDCFGNSDIAKLAGIEQEIGKLEQFAGKA